MPHDLGAALDHDGLAAARVVIDQGDVDQTTAVFPQFGAAAGRIPKIVEVGTRSALISQSGKAAQLSCIDALESSAGNGHATVGGVQVQLVAVPTDLVALGIALGAAITRRG